MSAVIRRGTAVVVACISILGSGCGGDSTGPGSHGEPQPPAGSATQVPRVLGLSTIDGKAPPVMNYTSSTYNSDAWTDSGSAMLQDDSLLVIRTYIRWVDHGAGTQAPATRDTFTTGGRLRGDGIAILPYTNGTADTAFVRANGAIEAHLSLVENGAQRSFGTFMFARAYTGVALNPIPYVHVISPDTVPGLGDSAVVTLNGSSFLPTTQATWDVTTRLTVKYVDPNQVTVTIPAMLLEIVGTHSLAVMNPPPGGGERIFKFLVMIPEPAIMSTAPAVMPVNGGDFTLRVHGRGFTGDTRVLWNGAPRAAKWVSATDLDVAMTNADLQAPGTVQVAVQTLPSTSTPGGGTSGVVYFTIVPSSVQKLADVSVTFAASQLIADPVRPIVYAVGTPNDMGPSKLVAFDPVTGQTVWSLDVGPTAGAPAVSDDGQYLYLAAPSDSIVRVSLATHAVDGSVQLGGGPKMYQAFALAVAPGMPKRLAVGVWAGSLGGAVSLHVFDDSQQLGTGISGSHPLMIQFATPQILYGVNPPENPGALLRYAVSASGITLTGAQAAGLTNWCCVLTTNRAYTNSGRIFDLSTNSATDLPGFGTAYAIVPSSDGTMLYSIIAPQRYLRAYDIRSQQEIGAVPFNGPDLGSWGVGPAMVRWGADGVAFADISSVHFVRASFVH